MFSFDLPQFAALQVSLPTGGSAVFVHVGGGRFISKVPPIALIGFVRKGDPVPEIKNHPVSWDGATLPCNVEAEPFEIAFDLKMAEKCVCDAAALGDEFGKSVVAALAEVDAMLLARAELGIMQPPAGGVQ